MSNSAGVVASGCGYTAKAAIFALEKGGNAVDAAIAAQLAACVSEPLMTGLNAGGLVMLKMNEKIRVLDCFGKLPGLGNPKVKNTPPKRIVDLDYGVENLKFFIGAGSTANCNIAVALEALSEEYGSLPLATLAEPALEIAKSGVKCSDIMACGCSFLWPIISSDPIMKQTFSHKNEGKEPMKAGEIFKIPNIDVGIEKFVTHGSKYYSTGEGADFIIKTYREDLQKLLSQSDEYKSFSLDQFQLLSKDDLAKYNLIWREPMKSKYRDAEIYVSPPPSQSGVLNLFSLQEMEKLCSDISNDFYHQQDYIYAYTSILEKTKQFREEESFLLEKMKLKDNDCSATVAPCSGGNTTHFSVADRFGNLVGFTTSLGETAGLVVPEIGMILNNFLGEDSLVPPEIDFNAGDRLLTNCCPSIVNLPSQNDENDQTINNSYILGSAGSDRIRTAILQGILGLVDGKLQPNKITNLSRIHLSSNVVQIELPVRIDQMVEWEIEKYEKFLQKKVQLYPKQHFYFGGLHIVGVHKNHDNEENQIIFSGGADPRRFGSVLFAEQK